MGVPFLGGSRNAEQSSACRPLATGPLPRSLQSSESLALSGNAELKGVFARHGWPAIVDMPSECAILNEHCCVCHQWIANPKHMKTHVQCVHTGLWLIAPVLRSPCQYFNGSHCRPDQHARKCTVIWQACCLQHVWELQDHPGQFDLQGPQLPAHTRKMQRAHKRLAEANYRMAVATGLPLKKKIRRDFFGQ